MPFRGTSSGWRSSSAPPSPATARAPADASPPGTCGAGERLALGHDTAADRAASRRAYHMPPGVSSAAPSGSDANEGACIAFVSFVGCRASVAHIVRWSGKLFTRSHGPAFDRTHRTHTLKPRHPASLSCRVPYCLYGSIARHAPCNSSCGRHAATGWCASGRVVPAIILAWPRGGRGGGTERVERGKIDAGEILAFVVFGVAVLCGLAWRRHYRIWIFAFHCCAVRVGRLLRDRGCPP